MASEQLMQEDLEGRGAVPKADISPDLDDESSAGTLERAAQLGATNGDTAGDHYDESGRESEDEFEDAEDAEGGSGFEQEDDESVEGDEEDDYESGSVDEDAEGATVSKRHRRRKNADEEDEEDADAEEEERDGEEEENDEDELDSAEEEDHEDAEMDADADIIEDAEGVGAVKIRPGETDEDDDSEASAEASQSSDEDWDETVAIMAEEEEDEDEEDEEDEEEGDERENPATACLFCKLDAGHGSSEGTDAVWTCSGCSEIAHEECAEKHGGVAQDGAWQCPDCVAEAEHSTAEDEMEIDGDAANSIHGHASVAGATPKETPAAGGSDHAGDAPRSLRKRRSSPIEPDEGGMSLRKRRKNTSEGQELDEAAEVVTPSAARMLRAKPASSLVTVEKRTRTSFVLKMRVSGAELRKMVTTRRKYTRRKKVEGSPRPGSARSAVHVGLVAGAPPVMASSYIQPFYSFFDKETDDVKGKPYGGILTEAEADTSRTFPGAEERRKFGEAKQQAEEERQMRLLAAQAAELELPKKRSKKVLDPASQIECIEFGGWEIGTWYAAPYPEEYSRNQVLYICEFCLKYMNSDYVAWRHKLKCPAKHPPGDEIYRDGSVSVFEVDGRKNPVYCQNLCLLAKLFLGSKTLYYDVEPFLFYVLCEYDELGYHFVGYFSKEKRASSQNNVSCILTLPIHQRKGYGNLLIDFSYLLTRVEKKTGSPEKPLSDMGLVSYRNYWRLVLCRYLLAALADTEAGQAAKLGLSIKSISDDTGMTADDVISALEGLRCLVRDPQTGVYAFRVDLSYCRDYVAKWETKKYVTLNPDALTWTPYVMGRGNATNFELGPALTAIARRDEEEEEGEQRKSADELIAQLVHGNGTSDEKLANGCAEEKSLDTTIIESTEQEPALAGDEANGGAAGTVTSADATVNQEAAVDDAMVNKAATEASTDDWTAPYADIPPTRFVVFPPVQARRLNYARTTTIGRPPAHRASSSAGGRGRHGNGGAVRQAATPRPKTGSSRKKSGGTGRGPGRWPKGTKKSDYGNADSGPGLPPAWIADRQARMAVPAPVGAEDGAEDAVAVAVAAVPPTAEPAAEDTVQVQTPPPKLRNGIHPSVLSSGKGRSSPRLGKNRELPPAESDTVMVGGDADQ